MPTPWTGPIFPLNLDDCNLDHDAAEIEPEMQVIILSSDGPEP